MYNSESLSIYKIFIFGWNGVEYKVMVNISVKTVYNDFSNQLKSAANFIYTRERWS